MPIYEYRNKKNGARAEIFQKLGEPPFETTLDVDFDLILNMEDGFDDAAKLERVPSAPGGFRGLPTPRFHR